MFGQRASSQIVFRLAPWMSFLTSKYRESALGARTFIHSGRRGLSATGSEVSMNGLAPDAGAFGGRELLEGQVEDLTQRFAGKRSDLVHRYGTRGLTSDRGEGCVLETAG